MVGGVLLITVVLGVLLAMLLDQPIWGQGVVRIFIIAPFFVMPTVSALVWKNMMMDPVNGIFAHLWRFFGAEPVAWLQDASLSSVITDRIMAVAALCNLDSAHSNPVAGQ